MNHKQKGLFYLLLLIMIFSSFNTFQLVQSKSSKSEIIETNKSLKELSDNNIEATPSVTFIKNYQEALNFTNDGLMDAILLKTEFKTTTEIYVNASYTSKWSYTKTGYAVGIGGGSRMDVPAGTYNATYFLGLDYELNANNPNVLVNGSYTLSFTYAEKSNLENINSISFPEMNFSFNSSKISNLIHYEKLLSPVQQMFLNRMTTNTKYMWNYQAHTGSNSILTEIGNKLDSAGHVDNGTISLVSANYIKSFSSGKFYDSTNSSFTESNVPVGYPFSFLKLPSNLTLKDYTLIFNDAYVYHYGTAKLQYSNKKGILETTISTTTPIGSISTIYQYNQSTGILLYYNMNLKSTQYNEFEKITLVGYTYENSKSTPFNGLFSIVGLVTASLIIAKKKKRT